MILGLFLRGIACVVQPDMHCIMPKKNPAAPTGFSGFSGACVICPFISACFLTDKYRMPFDRFKKTKGMSGNGWCVLFGLPLKMAPSVRSSFFLAVSGGSDGENDRFTVRPWAAEGEHFIPKSPWVYKKQ